ncbi:MAG: transketolase [Paracoccaceae bacterium]|jgi:transketolase
MGDQVGVAVSGTLYYVPEEEFTRILKLNCTDVERVDLFAALCRINTLYMIARCGSGHIGSSFSSLDIMSWMHVMHLKSSSDVFFSSKGHDSPGLYNVLLGLDKLDFNLIHKLRRVGGLPGHPDVATPNIVTNTGSLGMGVSKAKGMVIANRLQNKKGSVYVLTGDGELQEGQFWESLASAVNYNLHEITVIIDHNKLQSDTLVSKVSDLGDLEAKLRSFGWHVSRCDGNNLSEFSAVLTSIATVIDRPKVIIADTIKGKGVSFMEHTSIDSDVELYKYHSGAPTADAYVRASQELIDSANIKLQKLAEGPIELESINRPVAPLTEEVPQKLVVAYTEALIHQAEKKSGIVALDADLILDTGLIPFEKKFPSRFIECGIAEQDMVSQAGGMALNGLLPIVHSFACFLTARPNEQIYNNSTERSKIIYVGTLAGIIPGGPGHSHQGVRDISSMGAMPGMTVVEPSCEAEVGMLLDWAINTNVESTYIRLVSLPTIINFELPDPYALSKGQGIELISGKDGVLFAYGPAMLSAAITAVKGVKEQTGISVSVVNLPWLNVVDQKWLKDIISTKEIVFSIDNHYSIGGQGDRIANAIMLSGNQKASLVHIALEDIPVCGTNEEILSNHSLDSLSIASRIKETYLAR